MKIVDSHIHFWHPDQLRYEWLDEVPKIKRPFLPQDLQAQEGEYELEKIVFVQAVSHPDDDLKEAQWVAELAKEEPRIQGIVAGVSMEKGTAVIPHLEQLAELDRVKGVRRVIQGEADGFGIAPDFVKAVQLLPQFGFSFDICLYHPQLPEAVQLVETCPDVDFVLDHFGKPGIKAGLFDQWAQDIVRLAAFPNVKCKLSGIITEADHEQWTAEQLRPYINHILETFGPGRLMYGGDWPVSLLAIDRWQSWVSVAETAVSHLSAAEKQQIFYQNAIDFYRL